MPVKTNKPASAFPVPAKAVLETPAGLAVSEVVVSTLKAYENNPRDNDAAVPAMVELIQKFGFRVPILVRGKQIVDGHLRVKAATALGMHSIPAIDVGKMTKAEERALRIAVNKSVEWADWDPAKLRVEFDALAKDGFELKFTGFSDKDVARISKSAMADDAVKNAASSVLAPKNKDADAGNPADPNYVSITFHMTAVNRDLVLASLRQVQQDEGLGNVSQALIHVLTEEI